LAIKNNRQRSGLFRIGESGNMYKKAIVIVLMSLIMLISIGGACAETIEKKDVAISAGDDESQSLFWGDKDDKIDIKVTSDIEVDVYIMESGDYSSISPDYSKAKVSKMGVTSTEFTYTVPDDQKYYLVISNPNNATATVDYEYTDLLEEDLEELGEAFGMAVGICIAVVIVVIVVIILIIYLIFRKKSPAPPPPGVYPPQQQPGYQQPPQGQYPPPQPPPQQPPTQ
jgi:flagellar basal body-associated protein FliL